MNIERPRQPNKHEGAERDSLEEKKAKLISRFIETRVLSHDSLDEEKEEKLAKRYEDKSEEEKAVELYQKMIVYMQAVRSRKEDKLEGKDGLDLDIPEDASPINPKLISRIKILYNDPNVRRLIPSMYGRARVEQGSFKTGDLTQNWGELRDAIDEQESEYEDLSQKVFQEKFDSPDDMSEAEHELIEIKDDLAEDRKAQRSIEELEGYERTPENTDATAQIQYEKILEYNRQNREESFVWLPSRQEIDREAMAHIESGDLKQTRKGIFFISESGTGKSALIRAISDRLTGADRVKIACGPRVGDNELIGEEKIFGEAEEIEQGTFVDYQGTVTGAWTGFDFSHQDERVRDDSRVVELDELPTAFANRTFFSRLKGFFSLRDGDKMPGTDKEVLPGRLIFASGNVGSRHGHPPMPEALKREFRVIPVDYPEMSSENPELYEFLLASLLENESLPAFSERDISPAYRKVEFDEEERETLSDGSVVLGEDVLIEDPTSVQHGYLYRLAHAVKAVQDSYMAGGGENEFIDYTERNAPRIKDDDSGGMYVVGEGGRMLTLTTTITLDGLNGWMRAYLEEKKRKNPRSLGEFMRPRLEGVINEKQADREGLKAIFEHFNLLDVEEGVGQEDLKVFSPKEIGYLSPRVPRPLHLEKPVEEGGKESPNKEEEKKLRERETDVVLLEDGTEISIKIENFGLDGGGEKSEILIGEVMSIDGENLYFAGLVDDEESPHNGKPILKKESEGLYRVVEGERLEAGILAHESMKLIEEFDGDISEVVEDFWEAECVDNAENNPEGTSISELV